MKHPPALATKNTLNPQSCKFSPKTIHAECSKLCLQYGFDHFIYIIKRPLPIEPNILFITGSKNAIQKKQNFSGILRTSPGQITLSKKIKRELGESSTDLERRINEVLYNQECTSTIESTVSFPVQINNDTVALLLLSSTLAMAKQRLNSSEISHAQEFCRKIYEGARNFMVKDERVKPLNLTARELECIKWAADGKTNWEISRILGVSKRTIIFHLTNAGEKLQTCNRLHTVSQAIIRGLIRPSQLSTNTQ